MKDLIIEIESEKAKQRLEIATQIASGLAGHFNISIEDNVSRAFDFADELIWQNNDWLKNRIEAHDSDDDSESDKLYEGCWYYVSNEKISIAKDVDFKLWEYVGSIGEKMVFMDEQESVAIFKYAIRQPREKVSWHYYDRYKRMWIAPMLSQQDETPKINPYIKTSSTNDGSGGGGSGGVYSD